MHAMPWNNSKLKQDKQEGPKMTKDQGPNTWVENKLRTTTNTSCPNNF